MKTDAFFRAGAVLVVMVIGALWHQLTAVRDGALRIGGSRRVAAGWVWLEVNRAWEQRDARAVRHGLRWAIRVSPETLAFRLNGARMLAYDFPAWRAEREPNAPEPVRAKWRRDAARDALAWLEEVPPAMEGLALDLERGALCLHGLRDPAAAVVHYQRAAQRTDAPDYVRRIACRLAGQVR